MYELKPNFRKTLTLLIDIPRYITNTSPSIITPTPNPTELKKTDPTLPPIPVKIGSVPLTPPAKVPFPLPVATAVPVSLLPAPPVPVGISTEKSPFVFGNFPPAPLVPELVVVLVALAFAGFGNLTDVVGKGSLLGGLGSGLQSPAIQMSPPQQQVDLQHMSPTSQQKPLHLKELVPHPPDAKTELDRKVDMIMSVQNVVVANFIMSE